MSHTLVSQRRTNSRGFITKPVYCIGSNWIFNAPQTTLNVFKWHLLLFEHQSCCFLPNVWLYGHTDHIHLYNNCPAHGDISLIRKMLLQLPGNINMPCCHKRESVWVSVPFRSQKLPPEHIWRGILYRRGDRPNTASSSRTQTPRSSSRTRSAARPAETITPGDLSCSS